MNIETGGGREWKGMEKGRPRDNEREGSKMERGKDGKRVELMARWVWEIAQKRRGGEERDQEEGRKRWGILGHKDGAKGGGGKRGLDDRDDTEGMERGQKDRDGGMSVERERAKEGGGGRRALLIPRRPCSTCSPWPSP